MINLIFKLPEQSDSYMLFDIMGSELYDDPNFYEKFKTVFKIEDKDIIYVENLLNNFEQFQDFLSKYEGILVQLEVNNYIDDIEGCNLDTEIIYKLIDNIEELKYLKNGITTS